MKKVADESRNYNFIYYFIMAMSTLNEENAEIIKEILTEFEDLTYLPGPILQKVLRFKAELLIGNQEEELNLILNLVESHIPGLRFKAEIELDATTFHKDLEEPILKKEHLSFTRTHSLSLNSSDVDVMLERIAEMPKEWTVVQFTPQFCIEEIFAVDSERLFTSGINLSVFKCGQRVEMPYSVTLLKDDILTSRCNIRKLKNSLKEILSLPHKEANKIMSQSQKKMYYKKRLEMEDELEGILQDLEERWLGAWKCLLIGKYIDDSKEVKIRDLLNKFFVEKSLKNVSKKIENILVQAVKGSIGIEQSMDKYIEEILSYCFPGKKLEKAWKLFWRKEQVVDVTEERHPIILIIDETLDAFPWELISTLIGHPSSRMPSLHLLYAIFKAHQDSIVGGYKIISNHRNGKYILNPGLDLGLMETRLKNFFDYWLPDWTGIAGQAPTSTEFRDLLTNSDIFSGHGSGTQYCPSEKIQKKKINAVVFLFGCGSTQLVELGPQVEMYGTSQMYLLAACPCLIGMLWVVTDIETDMLTTKLLSSWISNSDKIPWHEVDPRTWAESGKVVINTGDKKSDDSANGQIANEPDLLRALCLAKNGMKYRCNRAAVVARGIPVKLG